MCLHASNIWYSTSVLTRLSLVYVICTLLWMLIQLSQLVCGLFGKVWSWISEAHHLVSLTRVSTFIQQMDMRSQTLHAYSIYRKWLLPSHFVLCACSSQRIPSVNQNILYKYFAFEHLSFYIGDCVFSMFSVCVFYWPSLIFCLSVYRVQRWFFPYDYQIVQEMHRHEPENAGRSDLLEIGNQLTPAEERRYAISQLPRERSKHTGFAFDSPGYESFFASQLGVNAPQKAWDVARRASMRSRPKIPLKK